MEFQSEQSLVNVANEHLKVYKRTAYGKLAFIGLIFVIATATNIINFTGMDFSEQKHISKIQIDGEIGTTHDTGSGYAISDHLLSAINNKDSLAIVLEVDSPGGSPTDSQIIENVITQYKALGQLNNQALQRISTALTSPQLMFTDDVLRKAALELPNKDADFQGFLSELPRKPIIAVVSKLCASACIQAVIHADIIVAQKASLVGNVGVRMDSLNWSTLAERLGVKNTVIASGVHKDMLSPWTDVNDEQIVIARKMLVNPVFEQFKETVITARGNKLKMDLEQLFSGLVWSGLESRELGLVDINADKLQVQKNLEQLTAVKYKNYSQAHFGIGQFLTSTLNWLGLN
ncbi:S49 family peptidase [Shewanella aestuarii]|uniref:S49 family peptidase n=1 Tax=Shewanella aestuarii TaxID=1028752 RepID=A0A6G9QPU1_9GAMM|nr:S49 family peptidase [Shewanella aestuarii]QIR16438.1 S49 family peptidase [Shewanella aestuarii]